MRYQSEKNKRKLQRNQENIGRIREEKFTKKYAIL